MSKISYQILDNGRCSYCGRFAHLTELPNGDAIFSDICESCESFNLEEEAEATDIDFDEF